MAAQDNPAIDVYPNEVVDFGIVKKSDTPSRGVVVQMVNPDGDIALTDIRVVSLVQQSSRGTSFTAISSMTTMWIEAGEPYFVEVSFNPPHEGRCQECLELEFCDVANDEYFIITRKLVAIVGSKEDYKTLKKKGPYVKRKFVPIRLDERIVRAKRPFVWTPTQWKSKLPAFNPPKDIIDAVFKKGASENDAKRFMPSSLSMKSYDKYFTVLIHIEAEHRSRELDIYSMPDAVLVPDRPRFRLAVDGLQEGRPSVLVGDFVLVKKNLPDGPWIESRVHKVEAKEICLSFPENFRLHLGETVHVRFQLNRIPFRRMLQAVATPFKQARILFPRPGHPGTLRDASSMSRKYITPLNSIIATNQQQTDTVAVIANQAPGSVPFIIFGPPGTGKTVTLVEAMSQLLDRDENCRILACAPSNAAADLIAEKMTFLGPDGLFRLNALSRNTRDQTKLLKPFSLINNNLVFAIPPLEDLQNYRVIVTTCVSGGILSGLGFARGHFNYIFVDEAGQASEPEVMIPIKTMADNLTNVILSGDHKQMGPNVRSHIAEKLGLNLSFLDRLMAREVYDLTEWRGITVVKLVKNFRSHRAILEIPNRLFYGEELVPCGVPGITDSLLGSHVLVKKGFPIVFHGVVGEEEQEEPSPSFFNIDEASLVRDYCEKLIQSWGNQRQRKKNKPVLQEDIGVITPYHGQKCKIIELFRKHRKLSEEKVKIGSVEEFQGRERQVIILSTVRSKSENLQTDIRTVLGFVANPARFNVAITRAQAMLIVIGNPHTLALDSCWRYFLEYVHRCGGWTGEELSWGSDSPNSGQGDAESQGMAGELEVVLERLRAEQQLDNDR